MTCLHGAFAFRRLRKAGAAGKALSQDVFDALFDGFDEALRDIGTGDLSVGKKIRKMGEAFYGRAKAYDDALGDGSEDGPLAIALRRESGARRGRFRTFRALRAYRRGHAGARTQTSNCSRRGKLAQASLRAFLSRVP